MVAGQWEIRATTVDAAATQQRDLFLPFNNTVGTRSAAAKSTPMSEHLTQKFWVRLQVGRVRQSIPLKPQGSALAIAQTHTLWISRPIGSGLPAGFLAM